jgi:spore germination protein YaaH
VSRRLLALATLLALIAGVTVLPAATLAKDPVPPGSVVLADGRVLPPMPADLIGSSVHAEMLASEGEGHFAFTPGKRPRISLSSSSGTLSVSSASALPNGLRKEVFGFLPYWMLNDTALSSMNYHLVSTIAYFSVGANRDGALVKGTVSAPSTGWAGWTSSRMTNVIDQAHANGVRVVLTVSMMAWDSASAANMAAFLGSSSARASLVKQIVAAVKDRDADGVNLDFEMVASSVRDQYTSFVRQLKAALVAAGVGRYLTVCTTAGAATWATGYDVAGLTASGAADAIFVMGYDYSWSGSARAGAVAPIDSPYTLDVNGTMNDFLSETSGSKLIWGVPYYGRTWPTSSNLLNATTIDGISHAYYYTGHLAQAQQFGRIWDDVGKTPWYRYWDSAAGNWVEGYYDDPQSLAVKYDLVNARGLAGMGMWTLLMDQGHNELWRVLADKFVTDTEPPVGGVSLLPSVVDASAIKVRWKAIDYASGLDSYDVQERRVGSSTWAAWMTGTQATSAWFSGVSGATYEFRVAATDLKGNRQPWISVPAQPATLTAGTFARVAVDSLNVRGGAGTGYPILATLGSAAVVDLLSGPTSADGYSWWRVQYGFNEWPSADYPHIGFVAAASGSTPFLVPSQAPTIVRLDPFVAGLASPRTFSPNGDGVQDSVKATYRLRAAASIRLDVLSESGTVVRSITVGAQASGANGATWDGRLASGAWAPAGRYLLRITATEAGGASHVAPTAAFDPSLLDAAGVTADLRAPKLTYTMPASGGAMLPDSTPVVIRFNEPVSGVTGATFQLANGLGSQLTAGVTFDPATGRATLTPSAPLRSSATFTVTLGPGVRDAAGNPMPAQSWSFRTAPGQAFSPWRRLNVLPGTTTGYTVGAEGHLTSGLTLTFSGASSASTSQRALLPNLPGRWLYIENGVWAGRWVRESPISYLAGQTQWLSYPSHPAIALLAGTFTGYRFDANGAILGRQTASLGKSSAANTSGRAIINGRPYFAVVNGIWAGYWLPESSSAYRPGAVSPLDFPGLPQITFSAGTYTGYRYDDAGHRLSSLTATLPHSSAANAAGWAVINGRSMLRVANGIWAGYWLPEASGISFAVSP